jgi:hypothetical protein
LQILALACFVVATVATDLPEYQTLQEVKKPIVPILKQTFDQHHEGYQFRSAQINLLVTIMKVQTSM